MLIGVLLAVAAMPVSSKQQKKNTAGEQSEDMQKSVLEEKLEAFLENTEGVGKVQVILMTDEKKAGREKTMVSVLTRAKKCAKISFVFEKDAGVAQSVEQLIRNQQVAGCC